MGFFQGFLSQLVLPGELQKTGVFDIASVGSWVFFAGNPFNNEKNPSNRQGKHPQNLASRKGFRKVVEVLDVGFWA